MLYAGRRAEIYDYSTVIGPRSTNSRLTIFIVINEHKLSSAKMKTSVKRVSVSDIYWIKWIPLTPVDKKLSVLTSKPLQEGQPISVS